VIRTPTGEISSPSTSTPAPTPETVVRPPPTPTRPTTTPSSETKTDAKPQKSLLNEEGPKGAPEKYEDFKTPEGFTIPPEIATEISTVFKEVNISQADGQKLIDLYAKHTQEALQAPADFYADKQEEWRNTINADPEIGGSKLNGVRVSIAKLIDSLGDSALADGFREAMDYTGAGNHPAVVKWLSRIAQKLTEGGPVRGAGPSLDGMRRPGEGRPTAAQAIYPHLKSTEQG
jgi:hypothetical protein